jgi:DNA-binding beta-propeller fold protein YncE
MANGNLAPKRVIEGQATKLGRTMHGIDVDPIHDEIVVANALASSILIFRASANGNEPPIRVIQGPRTGLIRPHSVAIDLIHDEIMVADPRSGAIFTFARSAEGDVPPLRVIRGPKTNLFQLGSLAVDPAHDLILIANDASSGVPGLYIFKRTDDGDVAPRASIKGPKTGLVRPFGVVVYNDNIILAARRGQYITPYAGNGPKSLEQLSSLIKRTAAAGGSQDPTVIDIPSPWDGSDLGFVAVWNITDNGDVPPRFVLRGTATGLIQPAAVAIDPKHKEVFATDSPTNSVYTFLLPEVFEPFRVGSMTGAALFNK